ncbi:MAG: acyl dehydratase [Thermoleophilaceae bacterium]|nr:acyl dehydratase [Thermoleophilaceae bacterium]
MLGTGERALVGGPYFEDFELGQVFDQSPTLTLTPGHAALHQALVGDRLKLALDAPLSRAVTGHDEPLTHPSLVCDVAIGQSTEPTQRVRGNLFYRGLVLLAPVFIGDTLRTRTEVVALKQNRPRDDGSATGLVVLRISTENQRNEPVLDFWRCAMIPLGDPSVQTGHADRFDGIPQELDMAAVEAAVPTGWRYDRFRERTRGDHFADVAAGGAYEIEGRDSVTAAPELARLTLNIASAHTDAGATSHGRRLVYGGHTIAVAAAQVARALPNLVTVVAWRGCDHSGPVFDGDILATRLTVEAVHQLEERDAGLVDLRAQTTADRGAEGSAPVLDWRFLGVMA